MIVDAPAGRFRGLEVGGVLRFRGIRYARAERFRPPELLSAPLTSVTDALDFGPIAPQFIGPLETMLGGGGRETSEDCLALNVSTPAADDLGRPVLLWIHGGSFTTGSGAIPWYDGGKLAAAGDVVVVTINYRLGALGYLYLDEVLGGPFAGSGNCGTLDQLAALDWVRANIAAFGGDPQRITLFGESAGAMSIGTLISLPGVAAGLYGAILQSGTGEVAANAGGAAGVTDQFLAELGLTPSSAELLLEAPVDDLLKAQLQADMVAKADNTERVMGFRPVVDGVIVPERPEAALRAGSAAGLRTIVGSTTEEWRLFGLLERSTTTLTDDGLQARLAALLGSPADGGAMFATYKAALPEANPHDLWSAVATDWWFRMPGLRLAEAQASFASPSWVYEFGYRSPAFDGALGACHAMDVPFTFNDFDAPSAEIFLGPILPATRALGAAMSRAWLAFATTGSPEHDGLPPWPAYDPAGRRAVLHLDTECQLRDDPRGAERASWDGRL